MEVLAIETFTALLNTQAALASQMPETFECHGQGIDSHGQGMLIREGEMRAADEIAAIHTSKRLGTLYARVPSYKVIFTCHRYHKVSCNPVNEFNSYIIYH